MKLSSLQLLVCPACHCQLDLHADPLEPILNGSLSCPSCLKDYPILEAIPRFAPEPELTGLNRRITRLYNLFSWIYPVFTRVAFSMLGISEEQARRQITDRLDPHGGRLLEVSIGTGANLPCLVDRLDVGEVFGMDLSSGQLRHCQGYLRRHNWQVELFQGNAEQLPFKDASFASVLHVGGINFFNDRRAAILEMIRVAEPGARILIADETEKGARGYEKTIPGFKSSFKDGRKAVELPIHLVPVEMLERRISEIWKGWFYCIEFRKPL